METLFTFALVLFLVWFAIFSWNCRMEWWLEICRWVKNNTSSALYSCSWLYQCVCRVLTVMTAQIASSLWARL